MALILLHISILSRYGHILALNETLTLGPPAAEMYPERLAISACHRRELYPSSTRALITATLFPK
jgi:hypothetical protein